MLTPQTNWSPAAAATLLPDPENLLRLPLGCSMVLAADSVQLGSWIVWKQHAAHPTSLGAANGLTQMAVGVALFPHALVPSLEQVERARELHAVVFKAAGEADGILLSWYEAVMLLARIVTTVCNAEVSGGVWTAERYKVVCQQVADAAADVLRHVSTIIPADARSGWTSRIRTVVNELQSRPDFSKEEERRIRSPRTMTWGIRQLISNRVVQLDGDQDTIQGLVKTHSFRGPPGGSLISRRMPERHVTSHPQAVPTLTEIETQVHLRLADLREQFRGFVEGLGGMTFGTFEEKEITVRTIKALAGVFGFEFYCEGMPVDLQIIRAGGRKGNPKTNSTGTIRIRRGSRILSSRASFPALSLRDKHSKVEHK